MHLTLRYAWSRGVTSGDFTKSFTYDALNRLTSTTVSLALAPLVKNFSYSAIGNLLSKSDVGKITATCLCARHCRMR